jgi:hypothetical protein
MADRSLQARRQKAQSDDDDAECDTRLIWKAYRVAVPSRTPHAGPGQRWSTRTGWSDHVSAFR